MVSVFAKCSQVGREIKMAYAKIKVLFIFVRENNTPLHKCREMEEIQVNDSCKYYVTEYPFFRCRPFTTPYMVQDIK